MQDDPPNFSFSFTEPEPDESIDAHDKSDYPVDGPRKIWCPSIVPVIQRTLFREVLYRERLRQTNTNAEY